MRNEVVMNQLIPFHKPNKNSEEWEDDGLAHFSNQTPYKVPLCMFKVHANNVVHVLQNAWVGLFAAAGLKPLGLLLL
jgi:hypothetical protein